MPPAMLAPASWAVVAAAVMAFSGLAASATTTAAPFVPNGGFEEVDPATGFAAGWVRGFGPGTKATAELDEAVAHTGKRSLRLCDQTPTEAYKYALVNSGWLPVEPQTTYLIRLWARGRGVGKAFVGAALEGGGEHREALPIGDYDWREITCRITTPATCRRVSLQIVADGVTEALWIDDVSLAVSEVQLANLREERSPRPYSSWFPRTPGPLPEHLVVADVSHADRDVNALLVALQGIVNRRGPRLYLLNPTNPPGYDEMWLQYLRDRGYTGEPERLADPLQALRRFRGEVRGLIVWDPKLPGSQHSAWMLAGLRDALPASPEVAPRTGLPVVEDLRGRWRRNVEAYRYVYDRYWPQMSHHLLAWEYPLNTALLSRDFMVQHKVFLFWVSSYGDREEGADPPAERELAEELLRRTPGNVPVMGWPMYLTRGMEEYTAVRLLSEYGKWVPGTGFCSNVSVHSAVRPPEAVFRQRFRREPPAPVALQPGQVYLSLNILDSGDAHWYWQLYQRGIWADPARGSVPIGYGMNVTLLDTLPAVAQWYYEKMTPNDSFFGLLYMNAPLYASRFRAADRERIWGEFVRWMDAYRRRLDMDGIELYNGGSGGPSAPREVFRRFTAKGPGAPGPRYILADLGRHAGVTPQNAAELVDDTVVFHTLTNFRVWTTSEELGRKKMAEENAWLLGEIEANSPRPGSDPPFISALAISWLYYPAWLKDLESRLPERYVVVSPGELARLYREYVAQIRK